MINRKFTRYNVLFAAIVLIAVPELFFRLGLLNTSTVKVEKELQSFAEQHLNTAYEQLPRLLNDTAPSINTTSNPNYLLLENNRPIYWSGNNTPFPKIDQRLRDTSTIHCSNFGNGYFLHFTSKKGNRTAIAFIRLNYQYKFSNSFLPVRFVSGIELPEGFHIHAGEKEKENHQHSSIPIKYNGKTLFYVGNAESSDKIAIFSGLIIFFQLFGILLLFFSVVNYSFLFAHRSPYLSTALCMLFIFVLKLIVSILFPFQLLNQADIFNPEIFAGSTLDASLGDFLLSFLAYFTACYYLYRTSFLFLQSNKRKFNFYVIVSGLIMALGIFLLITGLKSLVVNSKIDFFFKNIGSINTNTIIGICSLGFGVFGILFLLSRLRNFHIQYPPSFRILTGLFIGFLIFCYYYWSGIYLYQTSIFSILLLGYIAWPVKYALSPFNSTAIVLLIFSILAATIFFDSTKEKEKNDRILLAEKLSDVQDPTMEIDFSRHIDKISSDEYLKKARTPGFTINDIDLDNYLDHNYFEGLIQDYDFTYYVMLNDTTSLYEDNYLPFEVRQKENRIALHGKKTGSKYLYFIYDKFDGVDYMASIPLNGVHPESRLIIEITSKRIPIQSGMHELLSHNNQFYLRLISGYSFVRFVNNTIVDQRGNFQYPSKGAAYKNHWGKIKFFQEDGYDHLLFRADRDSFVIISRPLTSWLTHVTSFSYILIIYAVQFLLISILLYYNKIKSGFLNLSGKIQAAFIVLTILAMTLFGVTTQYSIGNQYHTKNRNLVSEKLQSLKAELDHKIYGEISLGNHLDKYVQQLLFKFSDVFNCDINFYSANGIIAASSAPKIFRYHLASPLMNPNAISAMRKESSRFIQDESIGTMNYISGYQPYYNNDGKLLGYLHIPYFPRQTAVDNEFSSLILAIVNIFVVLLAFTILLSVIVTQIIISPLTKIRESIATMQLNKVNKPIFYKGKDELADLVKEYNNKVAELEKFAFYLAQNERESAWREMAKQVAHEIKNPLTPMKLNIQHMQRSLKPNDPEFEQKIQRISQSLIEQIDTLTNIASEFSSLAKMPGSKFEKIDYVHLIESIVELYNDDEHTQIHFQCSNKEIFVNADREQLLRVLNNLVKNAQQAIPEDRAGYIEIKLEVKDNKVITRVEDNGMGISPEQRDKIFQPNFTSKSTGSGLGLAMVKNIVEQHGGTINFETVYGVGTSFIFELPITE